MKIAVIGGGRMGTGFAKHLAAAHEVAIGSRDPQRGAALAAELGASRGGGYEEVVRDADVVFLTVPWVNVPETLRHLGDLTGKVLVDVTNPYVDGAIKLHDGSSNAEEIARMAPIARVVKGWNTIFSQVFDEGPDFGGQAASVFLASDDEDAKATVSGLARDMGFDPIDCGSLKSSRSLERMLTTFGAVGTTLGWGAWALKVLTR